MDRKKLLRQIAQKLKEIRQPLKYSHREMADLLGTNRSSYFRYESGETTPQITSFYKLGSKYGISLDWLIMDRGPMYYKEKEIETETVKEVTEETPHVPETTPPVPETAREDVRELLDHMEQIPLLRYEILAYFYNFKEDRKEVVEAAMKETEKSN